MQTRYYVVGMGYDESDNVTDHEQYFGCFNKYEEAKELFIELMRRNRTSFFETARDMYQLCIQIEECEEDDEEITCVDVHDEWWLVNPIYKE